MKIKLQLIKIYIINFFSAFNFTDAVWVLLLAARGFSLWEIGVAEGVFHVVSLICEVPSGMLADSWGRRRTLVASHIMTCISCIVMIFSNSLWLVCISMAFNALGYNLSSGTAEALLYDSLLVAHEEKRYVHVNAVNSIIYSVIGSLGKLLTGVALRLGLVICYAFSTVTAAVRAIISRTLFEPRPEGREEDIKLSFSTVGCAMREKAVESARFIRRKPLALAFMLASSCIGACTMMTVFFLQPHFVEGGAGDGLLLGVLLFIVGIGGAAGARVAPKLARLRFKTAAPIAALLCGAGLTLCAVPNIFVAAFGGFLAAAADSIIDLVTDMRLNDMFPSSERATLISVNSMTYSLVMIGISPLYGVLGDTLGTGTAFLLCGIALLALTIAMTALRFVRKMK